MFAKFKRRFHAVDSNVANLVEKQLKASFVTMLIGILFMIMGAQMVATVFIVVTIASLVRCASLIAAEIIGDSLGGKDTLKTVRNLNRFINSLGFVILIGALFGAVFAIPVMYPLVLATWAFSLAFEFVRDVFNKRHSLHLTSSSTSSPVEENEEAVAA